MNSSWLDTLDKLGAELSTEGVIETKPHDKATLVVPLAHQSVFSVIGPQASEFLQGQLSCDMNSVNETGSGLGAHCNVKGSMVALFRLFSVENGFWLRVSHDLADKARTNINKYIIFSKADATDLSNEIVGLGLMGPGATTLIERLFEHAPSEVNGTVRSGNKVASRVPGNRFELWLPVNEAEEILPKLLEGTALGSTNDWQAAEIQAAIPDVTEAISETFIPQMANLQVFEGVSFTKGCYTGQEIVTRLQHRGKLNKPMYLAQLSAEEIPAVGSYIDAENRPKVGQIVNAAKHGDKVVLLAVITKAVADSETLYLEESPSSTLELLPLPYELDPELFERKR